MARAVKIGYDCEDVVSALYRHHPAYDGTSGMQWVCLREWKNVDLLAIECWQQARVIGYEVKVSRGDMRADLLDPVKRAEAVSRTTQFYFAVPAGMLTRDEIAFEEPEGGFSYADFERVSCPGVPKLQVGRRPTKPGLVIGGRCKNPRHDHRGKTRRSRSRWVAKETPRGFVVTLPVPAVLQPNFHRVGEDGEPIYSDWDIEYALDHQGYARVACPTCGGTGYSELSEVEKTAPTLWVPRDCGLVEIDDSGVRIVKRAPVRKYPKLINGRIVDYDNTRMGLDEQNRIERQGLALLVRHASAYQDPRHRIHRNRAQ